MSIEQVEYFKSQLLCPYAQQFCARRHPNIAPKCRHIEAFTDNKNLRKFCTRLALHLPPDECVHLERCNSVCSRSPVMLQCTLGSLAPDDGMSAGSVNLPYGSGRCFVHCSGGTSTAVTAVFLEGRDLHTIAH